MQPLVQLHHARNRPCCASCCACHVFFVPALATARPRTSWLACRLDLITLHSLPPTHLITTRLLTRPLVLLFTHIPARSHDHLLSRPTAHHLPIRPCGSLSFASHLFINHALTWGIGLEVLAIIMGAVHIVCLLGRPRRPRTPTPGAWPRLSKDER